MKFESPDYDRTEDEEETEDFEETVEVLKTAETGEVPSTTKDPKTSETAEDTDYDRIKIAGDNIMTAIIHDDDDNEGFEDASDVYEDEMKPKAKQSLKKIKVIIINLSY